MAPQLFFQHFEVLTRPDGSPHLLGKGSMGLTYKAFDRNLLSLAVVKVISPEYMGRSEARQRFLQEAQSMAKIKHPNVADVFFLGDSPQGVFYAMEYCDGPSVQEFIEEQGPMKPADVLLLGHQSAQALQAVERHNLIHRDIKPSNMILVNDAQGRSQIKLIDFGLARDVLRDPNLSQGGFVGTPTFASPEQLLEQSDLDIRSDIYSLGITLWAMLTGRPPFAGSQFEVMFHHVNTPPPWERLPAMPESARKLLGRMLEKSADERFQSPAELTRAFQQVLDLEGFGSSTPARLTIGPREKTGSVLGMSSFEILSEATDSDLTGKVFRARDAHNGQIIALKYLHPGMIAKPVVLGKIQRHVLSLRTLQHPNLVAVQGFEKSDDGAKIISEWVMGPSLLALLKARNQLTLRESVSLLAQLAGALDFAAAKGLSMVETDLHQILLTSPSWGEDSSIWAKGLRQPVDAWQDVTLKINPLRLSPAEQDYPSISTGALPDASAGGPRPLVGAFIHLTYRLLGGAGGSQGSSRGGGFVSIPGLGAEANDLLESFVVPPFSAEKRNATCADILRGLCRSEGLPSPVIFEPPPEPEEDLLMTRDATLQTPTVPGSQDSSFHYPGSSVPPAPVTGSQPGSTPAFSANRGLSPSQAGSHRAPGSRGSSTGGSHAGRISADYEIKRKELELQRQRLESEAERLKQEEIIEATRAMLDEERYALTQAREEFAKQERDRAQRAEQERLKLQEERLRLESRTSEVEAKRREQERLEQEIQLRAQFEFQKFEEERRQRESEWTRQREEIERSLKEREESSLVREQQSFKKIREERERLRDQQLALEQGQNLAQQEAEQALRQQVALLEAERQSLSEQQNELDRRLLAQSQELAQLRGKFDAAEREIESRYKTLAEEEAATTVRRQVELEIERRRMAEARALLEAQRAAFEADRAAGTAASLSGSRQREENEAALARLADEERRLAASRNAFDAGRSLRESALAADLAKAKQDLEEERVALAEEAEQAKQSGLAELESERECIAGIRAQLASQQAAVSAQVQEKASALEAQLAGQQAGLEAGRKALEAHRAQLDAEQNRLTSLFTLEKETFVRELEERREQEEAAHRRLMEQRVGELGKIEQDEQQRLAALRLEIANEEARLQQQRQEVFTQERLITRMDQEADYQDDEVREKFEAEQLRLESQRGEIEQKLLELHQAQKKRLVTIVAGTVFAVIAAGGTAFYTKGKLWNVADLKGQEAWVPLEKARAATLTASDWPKLLDWCVVTDQRFQKETDPTIKNFYKEKRPVVLQDAAKAVMGLLSELDKGWKPPASGDEAFKVLRQNLDVVSRLDGIPLERLLVLSKLDLPYLTESKNSGEALKTYAATISADANFIDRLKPELSVTVEGMLQDYLADHALDRRDELISQLAQLPEKAKDSVPRLRLLLIMLEAEAARSASPDEVNLQAALEAINQPATHPSMSAFFIADPEWAKLLRPEVDRILTTIQSRPEVITRMASTLAATAEQWKIDLPYMMLANASELNQHKMDYYLMAEKLTGNSEASARVAGYFFSQASDLLKRGNAKDARQLYKEARPRLLASASKGEAEAMSLLADDFRLGLTGERDVEEAIGWGLKAREKKHPDADYSLGLCYLEQAEEAAAEGADSNPILKRAEEALIAATQQDKSGLAAKAWFFLAQTYESQKKTPQSVACLEKGAQLQNPDCLFRLGLYHMAGKPYFQLINTTVGRDNVTKAARLGHPKSIDWLKANSGIWQRSKLPADREWLKKNSDLLNQ